MNDFSERLKFALKERGISAAELSKRTKIGKSSISEWINGKYEAKQDKVYILAKALNVDEGWLMGLDVPMEKEENLDIYPIYSKLNSSRQNKVYKFAEDQLQEQNNDNVTNFSDYVKEDKHVYTGRSSAAGSALYVDDADVRHDVLPASMVPTGADELVEINGNSMEPLIQNGDKIYIRYQPTVENGEIAIVRIENEGVTCKRVYVDGDTVTLKSENEEYSDMFFSPSEITILGKVLLK